MVEPVPEHKMAAAPPAGKRRRLRGAVAVCSWLALLVVLIVWMLVYAGDAWWPATFLMFAPRGLFVLPLLPLLLAALLWRRRSLGPLLIALLLILGPVMGFNVPWRELVSSPPQGAPLRVLTCNMHHQRPNGPALKRLLANTDPDVVVVQELPSREPFPFFTEEHWYVRRVPRLFLASRYPIRSYEHLGEHSMSVPGVLMRYELDTPAGIVTLISLHFASPRDGLYEATHSQGPAALEENSAVRAGQLEHLMQLADEVTGPLLLMGDFNTPTESVLLRPVCRRYADAFCSAGWGWGYTFRGTRTTVRIDHVLMGPGWRCQRCWIGDNVGSAHRPVLADLVWTGDSP